MPVRVEGLTDADFNARAPLHIDDVPTAREIRLKHNTWMLMGALVSALGVEVAARYIPVGFVLAVVMGLLVRETAKSAHENFPLPMYLLFALMGGFAGLVVQLKGWLQLLIEVVLWVSAASLVAFMLAGWDKARAQRGGRRVRERTLLLVAAVGGSLGLVLAMIVFHHKVRKPAFLAWVMLIVLAQFALVVWAVDQGWFIRRRP